MEEMDTTPAGIVRTVEWLPVWPQTLRPMQILASLVILLGVAVGCVLAWKAESVVGLIGFAGIGVLCGCGGWLTLRGSGFRWIRLSRRLTGCESKLYGKGIRVGPEALTMRVLIISMLCASVYYAAVALTFWSGIEVMLPDSRNSSPHAIFATVCGVVLAVLAMLFSLFRPATGIEIYRDVVIRTVGRQPFVRIGADLVVPWAAIVDVADAVRLNTTGLWTSRDPLIRLVVREPLDKDGRLGWDTDHYLQLPASWMAAEPNTLIAVLRAMAVSDESRREILEIRPETIFMPPPLRERIRRGII